ncbi:malate/lactate/ureidoglycolate dehydrogenase [Methylobacterium sp. NEAU 140]|uniref:malate/lactate/ureidoglycolate dehydrogenase n=1 Tax=Methylobacterium sp. NEAU 140 TaxID=3064945 RepID=UPI002734E0A2|nr:malate/lactate/ureidoglycolate dehydrogenase [Methylobacterium sp. NEAU 140]MDP4026293.1 malate/lactate/ureidoglycolate dehydrogenase [Methylobacterium sp. NEAU 140]
MRIAAANLTAYVRDIFVAEGCSEAEAGRIGEFLVAANLTGHDSHGVIRVPRYVAWLRAGELVADRAPEVIVDGGAFALVDAQYGFGQTAGPVAVDLGIAKAREAGVAVIALRHAGHLGRIGEWAERAAAAGLMSVHFVNVAGSLLVAPFGSVERRFSTAPFAAGFPVTGAEPIILDFATSAVAEGKVLVASRGGKPLPDGVLIEPDGSPSSDPATLFGPLTGPARDNQRGAGAIRAFGEHKGSGLALMCELLAGALTGSGTAGPGTRRVCNGMLSIYLAPDAFGPDAAIAEEARTYLAFLKEARPAPGAEVLVPGEPERRRRAERLAEGVPLPDPVWETLLEAGRPHGLDGDRYLG